MIKVVDNISCALNSWRKKEMKKSFLIAMTFIVVLSTFSIYITQTTSGLAFTQELLIDDPSREEQPAMFQDSTGKIWLFFVSDRSGHDQIHYRTSLDEGLTWSDIELFPPSFDPERNIYDPVVLQDSTGKIWVAWRNQSAPHNADQVWFTTSNDGENWTPARQLCPGHNDMGAFVEAEGKVWFFFSPLSNGWRVSYKTTDIGEESWSPLVPITTSGGMRLPHATVLANGTIFVVYRVGAYHYEANIGYSASSDGGLPWRSGVVNDPPYPEWDDSPRVIGNDDCIYVFFEHSYQQSGSNDIWFRVWNGSTWENPQQLTADGFLHSRPRPSGISNQLWVVWASNRNDNWDIWLAKCVHTAEDVLSNTIGDFKDLKEILEPMDPGAYNDVIHQYLEPASSFIVEGNYVYIDDQDSVKKGETALDMLKEAVDKIQNNFIGPGTLDPNTNATLIAIQEQIVSVARLLADVLLTELEEAVLTDSDAIAEYYNGKQYFSEAETLLEFEPRAYGDQIAKYKDAWKQGVKALELEWEITSGIARPP